MPMSPRTRVLSTITGKDVDRVPATAMNQTVTLDQMDAIGIYWPEAHTDPQKMAKLAAAAYRLTGLETARIPFCQTIEAEAMGCTIKIGDKNHIPAVAGTPYKEPEDVQIPDDILQRGRIPAVIQATKILKEEVGNELPIITGIVGPFTLASLLTGLTKFLIQVVKAPERVNASISKIIEIPILYGNALIDAGADVVVVEDMLASGDVINAKIFDDHVKLPEKKVMEEIKGIKVLHICGNVTPMIKVMSELGASGLSIDHKVDLKKAKEITEGRVSLIGNIDPVSVLLQATPEKVEEECNKALKEGIDLLAPGCAIAPSTSIKNMKAMSKAVMEFGK